MPQPQPTSGPDDTERRTRAVRKLFAAFSAGKSEDRFRLYLDETQRIEVEVLERRVESLIRYTETQSVPPLGKLLASQRGVADDEAPEERERQRLMRYHIDRYDDLDQHEFRRVYRRDPREVFEDFRVPPPEGVRFAAIPEARCQAERGRRWAQARRKIEEVIRALGR